MNLHIHFEFPASMEGEFDLRIDDVLVRSNLGNSAIASLIEYAVSEHKKDVMLTFSGLAPSSYLRIYLINKETGKHLVREIKNGDQQEFSLQIDLSALAENSSFDYLETDYSPYMAKEPTQYLDKSIDEDEADDASQEADEPPKRRYRSIMIFSKEKNVNADDPDYSFYDNHQLREDILTETTGSNPNIEVEVFYATDRKRKQRKKSKITYTNSRGDLELGKCIVNVPGNKKKGDLPKPEWYLLGLSKNEDKYMLIKDIQQLEARDFFSEIRTKIGLSPEKDAMLFVHGFNVNFTDSVLRTAQMAADIGFRGAPIVYSWPSRKSVLQYNADEATATGFSTENIIQLLKDVRTTTGAERVHLIAHSMGNRFLTAALKSMVDAGFDRDFTFNQVILAAPDIDAEGFVKNIAPKLVKVSERVTLYASQKDKALWFSKIVHGNIPRAGSAKGVLAWVDGMDTIDASEEITDFLGHGYFAETRALIDDIFNMTRFNKGPEERNLRRKTSEDRFYWEFW